jgi:hypothetical protein
VEKLIFRKERSENNHSVNFFLINVPYFFPLLEILALEMMMKIPQLFLFVSLSTVTTLPGQCSATDEIKDILGAGTAVLRNNDASAVPDSLRGEKLKRNPLSSSNPHLSVLEEEFMRGTDSPMRPSSPLPFSYDFLEVGPLARPGKGVVLPPEERDLLASAVSVAAHVAPTLREEMIQAIQKHFKEHTPFSDQEERHTDSWQTLEDSLTQKGKTKFKLIGYGSLLDPASSQEFSKRGKSILAFGVRRFFGFLPEKPENSPLGMPDKSEENALLRLTVEYTGSYEDKINGVLLTVNLGDEFEALRKREAGYDLIKVPVVRFDPKNSKKMRLKEAYILALGKEVSQDKDDARPKHWPYVSDPYRPHLSYLYVCLRGAMKLSLDAPKFIHFLSLFLDSTYVKNDEESIDLRNWIISEYSRKIPGNVTPRTHYCQLKKQWQMKKLTSHH